MLVEENKRPLISSFCSSDIVALLYVALEIDCKPIIHAYLVLKLETSWILIGYFITKSISNKS